MALRLLIVVLLTGMAGSALWLVAVATSPSPPANAQAAVSALLAVAPAPVSAGVVVPAKPAMQPAVQTTSTVSASSSQETPDQWLSRMSGLTGIPIRALRAYVNADLTLHAVQPNCHLAWTMLAGIGRIESNNGYYGGSQLTANGTETIPIIGVALNGSPGIATIADTDKGSLDGDPLYDRAVGPLQFLPGTWRAYASDGNGDRVADPQNIDDAAVTAGRYLCAGGRDLGTPAGWWAGVLAYNDSVDYAQKVFAVADAAAKASLEH